MIPQFPFLKPTFQEKLTYFITITSISGSPGRPDQPTAVIEGRNVVLQWTNGSEGIAPITAYYIQAVSRSK